MLGECPEFIDVGSDHGRLAAAMLLSGRAKTVLASDISAESLEKARALASSLGLDGMRFAVADGLDAVSFLPEGQSYSLAICGMGGEVIAGMIARGGEASKRARCIVMQPMGGERELRAFLYGSGYAISDEDVTLDAGRYYQLIRASYTGKAETLPEGALAEFGALAYEKRIGAQLELIKKKYASRASRLKRAHDAGRTPEALKEDVDALERLIKEWGDTE